MTSDDYSNLLTPCAFAARLAAGPEIPKLEVGDDGRIVSAPDGPPEQRLADECPRGHWKRSADEHRIGRWIHGFTRYRPGALACIDEEATWDPGPEVSRAQFTKNTGFAPSAAQRALWEANRR